MRTTFAHFLLFVFFTLMMGFYNVAHANLVKGIYITQETLEDTEYLTYLISRAKKVGITNFVIDLDIPSKKYARNISLVKDNHITYIARVVIFPGGGTPEQIDSEAIRDKKLKLMKAAIAMGADQIQIDYIRFNTQQKASPENAEKISKLIQWFKTKIAEENNKIPLQVDVFGITSFGPEEHIGQDLRLISKNVDVLCPMVYPSHFEPYVHHANTPYETVYDSLEAIKNQFSNKKFKLYPFIELSNYRYPLSHDKKIAYIRAQIQAAEDVGADGWYVWSPHNLYDNLFLVLEKYSAK